MDYIKHNSITMQKCIKNSLSTVDLLFSYVWLNYFKGLWHHNLLDQVYLEDSYYIWLSYIIGTAT